MDLSFTEKDNEFRTEVAEFIDDNFDADLRAKMAENRNNYLPKDDHIRWQKALSKKGWLTPDWPIDHGGTGWTTTQKYIFETEMANANAPGVIPFGIKMCAPVILKFGTEEQKKRFLPRMVSNEDWWCQGYSEPGSGSDLASLQMKAEDKGDHFLCNGSKIWTTLAQYADWIFCLVRTDFDATKHNGISFVLFNMDQEGVSTKPCAVTICPHLSYLFSLITLKSVDLAYSNPATSSTPNTIPQPLCNPPNAYLSTPSE